MNKSDKFMIAGLSVLVASLGFLGYRKMRENKKNIMKDNNEEKDKTVTNEASVELGKTENVDDVRKVNPKKVFKKVIITITQNRDGYFYNLTTLEQFREEARYQFLSDFKVRTGIIKAFPKNTKEMEELLTKTRTTRRVHQFLTDNRLRIEYEKDRNDSLQRVKDKRKRVSYIRTYDEEKKPDNILSIVKV